MTPLEADIAWHRRKAEETLSAITRVEAEPDSSERAAELRILKETLDRYSTTAEKLET